MNSSEAIAKIQELQDIYGDIEVLVNAQGSDNGFFKIITSVEIQEGMCDEDGKYTGNFHVAEITYITDYARQDGYVVLGIK